MGDALAVRRPLGVNKGHGHVLEDGDQEDTGRFHGVRVVFQVHVGCVGWEEPGLLRRVQVAEWLEKGYQEHLQKDWAAVDEADQVALGSFGGELWEGFVGAHFLVGGRKSFLFVGVRVEEMGFYELWLWVLYDMVGFFFYESFIGLVVKWKVRNRRSILKNFKYIFENYYRKTWIFASFFLELLLIYLFKWYSQILLHI